MTETMTAGEYFDLQDRHSGMVGTRVIDPTIEDPLSKIKKPNPNPLRRYNFGDGTYLIGRFVGEDWDFEVTDWGNVRTKEESQRKEKETKEESQRKEKETKEAKEAKEQEARESRAALPRGLRPPPSGGMDRQALARWEQQLLDALDDPNITQGNITAIHAELNP